MLGARDLQSLNLDLNPLRAGSSKVTLDEWLEPMAQVGKLSKLKYLSMDHLAATDGAIWFADGAKGP